MADQTLRTVRQFEFYARFVWPLHRMLARHVISPRCSKCAASDAMIRRLPTGLCKLCQESVESETRCGVVDDAACLSIEEILTEHEGAGRTYDALLLYSGGKDSTFLCEQIRRTHPKLRLLAYTIDNGFMSSVAIENIEELISKLNVDHVFVRPARSFYEQLFRYGLTHLNADGAYGTVDFSDGEFMLDTARSLAAEKEIPLILCGYSRYQVQNGLKLSHFESPREVETQDRVCVAGMAIDKIFSSEADRKRWWQPSRWPRERIARLIFPLYAWNIEEQKIREQVELWGLLASKNASPAATNHRLIPLLGVTDVHKFGYSSFEPEFCRMIREGKADRDTWQATFELLEYTAKTGLFVRPIIEASLKELGLSMSEVGIDFSRIWSKT